MIRVVELFFWPENGWRKIVAANRGPLWVFLFGVIPSLLLGTGLECAGLVKWGEKTGQWIHTSNISRDLAIRYGLTHVVLGITVVIFGSWLIHLVATSFNVQTGFGRTFSMVVYAITPIFLVRAFDGIPGLPTWIVWGVGAVLAVRLLYHGVGMALQPEQTKGLGIFIMSTLLLVASSGLAHFIATEVLRERILRNLHFNF